MGDEAEAGVDDGQFGDEGGVLAEAFEDVVKGARVLVRAGRRGDALALGDYGAEVAHAVVRGCLAAEEVVDCAPDSAHVLLRLLDVPLEPFIVALVRVPVGDAYFRLGRGAP